MQYKEKAKLLTIGSKDYDMTASGGPKGTSHKARLNIEGEIFSCIVTAEQVKDLKKLEGVDGSAVISLTSPKENLKISLVSFEE